MLSEEIWREEIWREEWLLREEGQRKKGETRYRWGKREDVETTRKSGHRIFENRDGEREKWPSEAGSWPSTHSEGLVFC